MKYLPLNKLSPSAFSFIVVGFGVCAVSLSSCKSSSENEKTDREEWLDEVENMEDNSSSGKLTHLSELENLASNIHFSTTENPLWDKHIRTNTEIQDAINAHARASYDYRYFVEDHPKLKPLFEEDKSLPSGSPRKVEIRKEIKMIGESLPEIMAENRKVIEAQIKLIDAKAAAWAALDGGKEFADQYTALAEQARALLDKK